MHPTDRSLSSRMYVFARRLAFFCLLLLFHSQAPAAATGITLVQHKGKDAGTNTTGSVAFQNPNTAGNFIAVAIRGGLSSSQVSTVKDSNGNTYNKATQIGFTASAVTSAIYYAENIKGGANTVTVSMTVNAPLRFAILEYSGVATSNSLDTTAAATGTGKVASSGNTTTAVNGDLLLGSLSTVNGATFTAGTGYVIRDSVPNGSGAKMITEDQIQAAPGTASATATLSASDTWGALLAAFKPAGGVAVPSISSLNPTAGPVGTSVTITGTNFGSTQGTSTVAFNGTAGSPTSWSTTGIVVPVPSGATTGNVVVTVGGVASNPIAFTVVAPPSITSLSPTFAPLGASVTITGADFGASQGTSTVTFNGATAIPTSWSAASIVVTVPSGATTGNVVVTVNGLASNGVPFSVAPSIASLSPTSGPVGTSVTITGTSFGATQGTSAVTFGAYTATPTSWSTTTIVVPVPAGATTGNVIVMVNGIGSNRVLFTVTPSLTSLSPTAGPVGISVTITGTSFGASQGTGTVTFNGTAATPTSWSATSIVVPVPSGANTGNVVVTVGGLASNGVPFTVLVPPSITSLSPTSGPAGTSVTISGTNFGVTQGTSAVTFNGTAATPSSWSATSIVVPVPSGATTGNVAVTVGSLASNGVLFTLIPPPSITSLSPTAGAVGTSVTIAGTNFGSIQGTSTVTFNGTSAVPTTWTNTGVVVPIPVGATTGNVVVTVNGLSSNGAPFTVNSISVSVSPSAVTLGTGAQQIFSATLQNDSLGNGVTWSLSGTGCSGAACGTIQPYNAAPGEVYNAPATAPNPSGVTLTATSVTDPTKSASATITVVQATAPNISSLNPSSGPLGSSIAITGTNFGNTQGSSVLWFNSTQVIPTSWSNTSIVAAVPTSLSGNANALVQVVVLGLASNQTNFSITPTPSITSLNPATGPVGSSVTITGANFGSTQGTSTVTFNGASATPTSWSATNIVVSVPAGATTGNVLVTIAGVASNGLAFTVGPDATPPTAPANLTAMASSAGEIDLYWNASTDNVGVSTYQMERCQGAGCTNFTLFSTVYEPNASTSMSDVSAVGSTSYSYRVRATDAAGNLSAYSNIASATTPGAATITSLNPTSGTVGTSITITGSGFGPGQVNSTVSFNGAQITFANSWSDATIVLNVPSGATTGNVVVIVGGLASNGVNFTVTPPPPPPTVTSVSPSSAIVGGGPQTITVTGTGFASSSTVQWNGNVLATTFLSSTQLQATVTSSNVASIGAARINVSNASVGGGVSNSATFFVGQTGGSNFATIVINQVAQDIVYDPTNQVFYLSVPGTASTNPNTIAILDPAMATIRSSQPAGNNPNVLAISDDSQFLYAGIDGNSTVERFTLPGLLPDILYSLGASQYYGPYVALDMQVAPGAPHTVAVSLGNGGVSPAAEGGITIFDDVTPRPTKTPGFGGTGLLFDSLQWGADAGTLFASNTEGTGFDFYALTVNSNGVTLNQDFPSTFTRFGDAIHFDPGTKLIYSDEGHAINPATGLPVGNFNATGVMAVDAGLNTAFFASLNSNSIATIESFDLAHFTPINTVTIPGVTGRPSRLIRWGQNGLAFIGKNANGTSQVVLLGGDFVSAAPPFVLTPPPAPVVPPVPAPNAPTISSLNPSSSYWPNQLFTLNVTGTQFDPAATVLFNGSALSTTYVSSTQLQAVVPPGTVRSSGTAGVVVANPPANGGNSASAAFFVGISSGTSSTGTGFAFQIVNQAAKKIAFDPASERLYLSVPSSATTGNTIAVLDPATDTIVGQQYAGSNPNALTISGDGQFLYAGLDGSSAVQRFLLPSLAPDIVYVLGLSSFGSGPFFALDLQVAPGSPHTTAVSLAVPGSSPEALGGVTIFDDATERPTVAKGFGPGGGGGVLYDSIQWGADATSLFAANYEDSGFDFYTLSVTSSGVSLTSDFPNTFSSFSNKIHFDPGTKLVYSDDGHVVDPATGKAVGTFSVTGLMSPIMVPDSSLNLAFFATQTGSNAIAIYSYNLTTFAPVSSIVFSSVSGNPTRLIRWGQNGLAFNTDAGQIVLVGGNFVH